MLKAFTKIFIVSIILILTVGVMSGVMATEQQDPKDNVWHGEKLSVDVKAGKNGYTLMSVYKKPYAAYEMSNHMVNPEGLTDGQQIPQTLILIDASKDYTWSPDRIYSPGMSNYEVLYCCDIETGYDDGYYYKRINLEDAGYYSEKDAQHIRAILENSYPFITLEQMKERLKANGYSHADELTRSEIIAAVQTAVWAYANDAKNYVYFRTFSVTDNTQWGGVLHDYTNEMQPVWWGTGYRVLTYPADNEAAKAAGVRIDSLVSYLKDLTPNTETNNGVVISKLTIVNAVPVTASDDKYSVALRVNLNSGIGNENDDVTLDIYVGDEKIGSKKLSDSQKTFDFIVEATEDQPIKAVVSGTQILPKGVYYYEPEGGRKTSQSLVGVSSGATSIYSEAETTFSFDEEPVTAELKLTKVDHKNKALTGAKFDLNVIKDNATFKFGSYETDANGQLIIKDLLPGSYSLVETAAPVGFLLPVTPILFTIDEKGTLSFEENSLISLSDGMLFIKNDPELVNISGTKTWNDNNDQDGKRPDSITVDLIVNGKVIAQKTVTAADGWKWSFEGLEKYENGQLIEYSVIEEAVDGYESTVTEIQDYVYDITNTHTPEKTSVSVSKVWVGTNSKHNTHPISIIVTLYADETLIKEVTLSAENQWTYNFTDLDKYSEGKEIVYTVKENALEDYKTDIEKTDTNVFVITNTYIPEKTSVSVSKTWKDEENKDGIRPLSITVNLLANGTPIAEVKLNAENRWTYTFADLDKYSEGKEIVYTVKENAVEGYVENTVTVEKNVFAITNVHVPSVEFQIGGTKYLDETLCAGYHFELIMPDGTVKKATSGEDGKFSFEPFRYTSAGEYTYTVKEVIGYDHLILVEYDLTVYMVTVKIVEEQDQLIATATIMKDNTELVQEIEFFNTGITIIPPEPPPYTGSASTVWLAVMLVSGALFAGQILISKKNKKTNA